VISIIKRACYVMDDPKTMYKESPIPPPCPPKARKRKTETKR
jgi:hypothetical protein